MEKNAGPLLISNESVQGGDNAAPDTFIPPFISLHILPPAGICQIMVQTGNVGKMSLSLFAVQLGSFK